MFDVDSVEGHNNRILEDDERPLDQLKSLLICTLFDWFCACGLTHCNSVFGFQDSL